MWLLSRTTGYPAGLWKILWFRARQKLRNSFFSAAFIPIELRVWNPWHIWKHPRASFQVSTPLSGSFRCGKIALRRSIWRGAKARNVSLETLYEGQITFSTYIDIIHRAWKGKGDWDFSCGGGGRGENSSTPLPLTHFALVNDYWTPKAPHLRITLYFTSVCRKKSHWELNRRIGGFFFLGQKERGLHWYPPGIMGYTRLFK